MTGRRLPEDEHDGAANVVWESDMVRALLDDADKWHAKRKGRFK
jgi:hypothetical protein